MPALDPQREDDPPAGKDSPAAADLHDPIAPRWTDHEPAALAFLQGFTSLSRQTPIPGIVSAFQRLERAMAAASLKSPAQTAAAGEAWYSIARALHVPETLQHTPELAHTAATAYQRALDLHCSEAQCYNNLGNLHRLHLHQPELAETCYLRAIALDPRTPTPHIGLGDLYQGPLHQPVRAEPHYLLSIALDATYWYPHRQLADLYQRHLHRYAEAEAHYLRALELSPQQVWAHCGLGRLCHYHLHQYARAEACYLRAIDLAPQLAFPHRELGNLCHYHLHQPARAEACYHRALELDPQDAYAHRTLGTLYKDHLHQPQRAEESYHRAIQAAPANPRAHAALGHLHESAHRWPQATAAYQQALTLDPTHGAAHRGLAWVALRSRNDLAEARQWAAQAEAATSAATSAAATAATNAATSSESNAATSVEAAAAANAASQVSSTLLRIALTLWSTDTPQAQSLWADWVTALPPHEEWFLWQNRDRVAALLRHAHPTGHLPSFTTALPPDRPCWQPFAQALHALQQAPTAAHAPSLPDPQATEILHLLQTPDPPAAAAAP